MIMKLRWDQRHQTKWKY